MSEIFDFDTLINRRNTGSYKWDSATDSDIIPLWVADMDFKTAPVIIEALEKRVEHGVFGYTRVPEEYYNATIDWFANRHGLQMGRDEIIYTSGVVPAISAIIKGLTKPGEGVLVMTPVYNCFFSSIRNNGCRIVESPLIYANHTYQIDWEDLEQKASDPGVTMFLLCNPHNPACRVWSRDELKRIGEIMARNNVKVVSDEIHGELVFPPYRYTPFAAVCPEFRESAVTCSSPSKAFNIAGLQIANIFAASAENRRLIDRAINDNEVCDVNPMGVTALIAAYRHGLPWLEALNKYLYENYLVAKDMILSALPMLDVATLEGTYLMWVDCRSTGMSSEQLEDYLLKEAKVWINAGTMYGDAGEGFIRINLACPRARLVEGINRIINCLSKI